MINWFLNLFGFSLVKTSLLTNQIKMTNDALKTASEAQSKYDNLFDFNKFEPKLSLDQFREKHNLDKNKMHWNLYWADQYRNEHIAYTLRQLSMFPDMLQCFLKSFSEYDWEKTRAYMEKVNWTWNDNEHTPTIEDLQYCVICLVPLKNFEHPENTIMSGGFEVTLNIVDGKPNCKIFFRESDIVYRH